MRLPTAPLARPRQARAHPRGSRRGPSAALLAVLLHAALAGCAGAREPPAQAEPARPEAWTRALADARGEARDCGGERFPAAPPLGWSDRLASAAAGHSADMAGRAELGHLGSGGETLQARITATGYRPRAWAENVAAGQPGIRQVVGAWLGSPGHCRNIMNGAYEAFGASMARGADGTPYWTLVLAAPQQG